MTREEAHTLLEIMAINLTGAIASSEEPVTEQTKLMAKQIEAIDMAIEALENKPTPCEKCIHVKSCRKVVILKNRTYKLVKYCSQGAERKEP